jgi:Signal transduction histidine kinase regulating C4-dicarboxylate transport system
MQDFFKITPRIIAHLGEDLIKNESIAVLELVKNSYDAYATKCDVFFEEKNGKIVSIQITDNGYGMNAQTIKDNWLVIGTDNKKKILLQDNVTRYPLGEKGIGRLGVHKLGRKITLISKKTEDSEVELKIDWGKLEGAKSVDSFPVEISLNLFPLHFDESETGTKIIIESLKTNWDKRQLREIYRNIMSLHSPFEDSSDQFEVTIRSNNKKLFAGLPTFEDIISNGGLYFGSCVLSDNKIKNFKYEFRPWPTLSKISSGRIVTEKNLPEYDIPLVGYKEVEGKIKPQPYEIDLDELRIGDIKFDIIIFEKDSIIFNFINTEKTTINDYLKENGGIRVYRDNVRVYDYGEQDNDWLGIDLKRVHRVGGNISNNIILGSVRLDRKNSTGLKEKTNREGFIEDDVYIAFKDAINHVLSIFVRFRNEDKERLTTLYKKNKTIEPILSDLNDAISLVNEKVSNVTDRNNILACLTRIDNQYKEVKTVLLKSANAGLNMSVVIHEIEKQVKSLMGCAERGESERVLIISRNIEKLVKGYSTMIMKSSVTNNSLREIIETALDNYEFRFSDHGISILTNHKELDFTAKLAKSQSISILANLLDNSIFWLGYSKQSNPTISIFVTDQIKDYYSIVISDNGPGFNIGTDVAVKPFISGKPDNIGMGMGLHIADEMMNAMGGKLMFYEKEDLDLAPKIIQSGATKAIIALCFKKQ